MTSAVVLTFHGVVKESGNLAQIKDPGVRRYSVTADCLRRTLEALQPSHTCAARDLPQAPVGEWIVLTFDDGLVSDYEVAYPLLSAKGLRATFFVNADNVGKEGFCSKTQLSEMTRAGMEVGSHGCTHRYLVTMPRTQAGGEITESKRELEDVLAGAVSSFAPVGGHYRSWMMDAARDAGYRVFGTMIPGRTKVQSEGILRLRRNHIQSDHDFNYIGRVLRGERGTAMVNRVRYEVLHAARLVLGMKGYDRLKAQLQVS